MQVIQVMSQAPAALPALAQQRSSEFITFSLGDEEYGIPARCVQEIRSYEAPTRIANAPAALRGMLHLRGVIVPVVDLRITLGCQCAALDPSTIVIVIQLPQREVAVVVDRVGEVLEISAGDVRPPAVLNSSTRIAPYIDGIGTLAGRMLILLDIERWIQSADMALLPAH